METALLIFLVLLAAPAFLVLIFALAWIIRGRGRAI